MIRNIVFDMGNVVIRFDPGYFMDRAGITNETDRPGLSRGKGRGGRRSAEGPADRP